MPTVLGSWKEIASYLGKGVRTVQRWERHSGLPVHRPSGSSKGVVLAFPPELDRWARRQDAVLLANHPTRLTIEKNTALSHELINQTRLLRDRADELLKICNHFLELQRQRRGKASEIVGVERRKAAAAQPPPLA
jgi:hypothetical protein